MSTAVLDISEIDCYHVEAEMRRRRWRRDPVAWVKERTGMFLWSAQKRILESVRDHRRTAVASCHGPGKSFTSAQVISWWIDTNHPGDAAAVTTAPTDRQVKVILWKEIRRTHAIAKLNGHTNLKDWQILVNGKEETVAFGMKPSDYDPAAFQGVHAKRVLVVVDEAGGVQGASIEHPHSLWDGADSLLSNDDCRELAIGNPDDPTSYFAKICQPGSGWNVIWISAFDTPNFTGELIPAELKSQLVGRTWVEEKRKSWAPTWRWTEDGKRCVPPEGQKIEDANPLWVSKVLGRFPKNAQAMGLIPIPWIEAAQERSLDPEGPNELGVDVGGGGDASCTAHRRGPVVRILSTDHNPDTMQTCGKVVDEYNTTGAESVKVDKIGIGAGITDRGKELGLPFIGVNVGAASSEPERFVNLRAELWWNVRERFEQGNIDIDPNDQDLAAELASLRFKRTSKGQVVIESKDEAKRRGVASPNKADAVMLSFAQPVIEPKFEVLW